MSADSDKEKILAAMGGKKGLLDSGLPALLFLIVFNIDKDIKTASYIALGFSLILTVFRLIKKETIQHAISGVIGVAICAWLSNRTGKAEDFYLPGLWTNLGYGTVYMISNLLKWPILGVIIGPLIGENFLWRKDPARQIGRAHV